MRIEETYIVTVFSPIIAYDYIENKPKTIPTTDTFAVVDMEPENGELYTEILDNPVKIWWKNNFYWIDMQDLVLQTPKRMKMNTEEMVENVANGSMTADQVLNFKRGVNETLAHDPFTEQEVWLLVRGDSDCREHITSIVDKLKDRGYERDKIHGFFQVIPRVLDRLAQERFIPSLSEKAVCSGCGSKNFEIEESDNIDGGFILNCNNCGNSKDLYIDEDTTKQGMSGIRLTFHRYLKLNMSEREVVTDNNEKSVINGMKKKGYNFALIPTSGTDKRWLFAKQTGSEGDLLTSYPGYGDRNSTFKVKKL